MRKLFLVVSVIGAAFIVIAAYFVLNSPPVGLTSKEREQALTQIAGGKANLTAKNVPTGDLLHQGKYVSFLYPAAAKIYQQTVNGKKVQDQGALDYFSFDLSEPTVNVVTEVVQAPTSVTSLSGYPSVSLRQSQSDVYKQSQVKAPDGTSGLAFEKLSSSGVEKTVFFLINGKIYSFSVTSVDPKTGEDVFNKIISSLKFY